MYCSSIMPFIASNRRLESAAESIPCDTKNTKMPKYFRRSTVVKNSGSSACRREVSSTNTRSKGRGIVRGGLRQAPPADLALPVRRRKSHDPHTLGQLAILAAGRLFGIAELGLRSKCHVACRRRIEHKRQHGSWVSIILWLVRLYSGLIIREPLVHQPRDQPLVNDALHGDVIAEFARHRQRCCRMAGFGLARPRTKLNYLRHPQGLGRVVDLWVRRTRCRRGLL